MWPPFRPMDILKSRHILFFSNFGWWRKWCKVERRNVADCCCHSVDASNAAPDCPDVVQQWCGGVVEPGWRALFICSPAHNYVNPWLHALLSLPRSPRHILGENPLEQSAVRPARHPGAAPPLRAARPVNV